MYICLFPGVVCNQQIHHERHSVSGGETGEIGGRFQVQLAIGSVASMHLSCCDIYAVKGHTSVKQMKRKESLMAVMQLLTCIKLHLHVHVHTYTWFVLFF